MTPEQKAATEHILAGKRGSMNGPSNMLRRSPEIGDMAQKFGAYMRYGTSLPHKLNELAILITGGFLELAIRMRRSTRARSATRPSTRPQPKFGERGVVDLIGEVGHYNIVSTALNTDRYPLPRR